MEREVDIADIHFLIWCYRDAASTSEGSQSIHNQQVLKET